MEVTIGAELADGDRPRDLSHREAVLGLQLGLLVHVVRDVVGRLVGRDRPGAVGPGQRDPRDHHQEGDGHLERLREALAADLVHADLDGLRAGRLEELGRPTLLEVRVGRLDDDEELVVGHLREAVQTLQRVVELRQLVQRQHAEEGGERREEDRRLEDDRDVGRERPHRLARDGEAVVDRVHPPLHQDRAAEAGQTGAEHEPGQDGRTDAHRVVQTVDREGRVDVPLRVPGVAHLAGGRHDAVHVGVLGNDAVDLLLLLRAHACDPSLAAGAWPVWA
ncbi:MAG: hypothetical protein R3F20_09245 [Planctomycetota bacterium]